MNVESEKKGRGRLYRACVSTNTSLLFLGVFAAFFFLGTVFPQSSDADRLEQYREAGGKFIALVGAFDLLNIFQGPYFGAVTLLFVAHLFLCAIHRLGIIRRRPTIRMFSREDLLGREYSFSLTCPGQGDRLDIEKILERMGFRRQKYYSEDARVTRIVCEKGFPYRWLSWLYHICFLLAIVGFGLSYLFAFENELSIRVGETESVALRSSETNWRKLTSPSSDTRWGKLMRRLRSAEAPEPPTIGIKLEEFISEHTEKAKLIYPGKDEPLKRFMVAWGLGEEPAHYEMPDDPLYPRDWFSVLSVYEGGELVKKKKIEVNDPLRHGGLVFYQMGYEYEFDMRVGEDTIENIKARTPFTIPQMEGEFRTKTPRLGILFAYDGSVEKLAPSARLEHKPPSGDGKGEWAPAGVLRFGEPTEIMRAEMTIENLRESSVLSYRYDPGVPLLWVASVGLIVLMTARIYLPWYQLRCHVDSSGELAEITVGVRMVGIFTRPARLREKMSRALPA